MKTKLDEAREVINTVDKEMIHLFIKRMAAVRIIAEYKLENDIPVLDSIREESIINKNLEILMNKKLEKYYLEFFDGVLNSSKSYQKSLIDEFEKNKK